MNTNNIIILSIWLVILLWIINIQSVILYIIVLVLFLLVLLWYLYLKKFNYNKVLALAKLLYYYWKIYDYGMYILYSVLVNPLELYKVTMFLI